MVFLVPYDGSSPSEAALDRAVEHARALETDVVAVSLIPTGSEYAIRRKWIEPSEEFALDAARQELKRKIDETTDEAERNYTDSGASTPLDGVAEDIRRVANDVDASVMFVGVSKNQTEADEESGADGLVTPFGSIAPDGEYDVHIVRSA